MEKLSKKTFKTTDLWLASALSLALKVEPKLVLEGNVVIFLFPYTAETLKTLEDITAGVRKFDFLNFSERVKNLRHKMMAMKREAEKIQCKR